MTKEQIKAAIAEKIAGQGNAVDQGGALGAILESLVDLIPSYKVLTLTTLPESKEYDTIAEFIEAAGITMEEFDALQNEEYNALVYGLGGGVRHLPFQGSITTSDYHNIYFGLTVGSNIDVVSEVQIVISTSGQVNFIADEV